MGTYKSKTAFTLSHTPTSNVRYISFQRNLQLKIHLSSYLVTLK